MFLCVQYIFQPNYYKLNSGLTLLFYAILLVFSVSLYLKKSNAQMLLNVRSQKTTFVLNKLIKT
ncbi:hypothetical protein SAMN05444484_103246 [Flavobacterium chilense]|uniref:Uncharacterized protein n=1 Tax=Flavobacterium chilense TaxID=946677 RepID=A0A1M7F6C3_9FLAO|nr:hypothetical protein SAMN05444484_103246 [Flavobacterium chilense]